MSISSSSRGSFLARDIALASLPSFIAFTFAAMNLASRSLNSSSVSPNRCFKFVFRRLFGMIRVPKVDNRTIVITLEA